MTLDELRKTAQRDWTSPLTEMVYRIRAVSNLEYTAAQLDCVIPTADELSSAPGL